MNRLSLNQISMIDNRVSIGLDKFIIILDTTNSKEISDFECNNNIYCVNSNYEVIWQIKAKPTGFERDPFTSFEFDGRELLARNFSGFKYHVNLQDGSTEMISWAK